jgi:hypothetical protein
MENINETGGQPPASAQQQQPQTENIREPKKKDAEFSIAWHLKILAIIYVLLGALYLVLKFTLK